MSAQQDIKEGDHVTSIHGGDVYRVKKQLFDREGKVVGYLAVPMKSRLLQADCIRKVVREKQRGL